MEETPPFGRRVLEPSPLTCKSLLLYLSTYTPQLSFGLRFEGWDLISPSCIVDGFDVSIEEPPNLSRVQRARFCAPKKKHAAIKYVLFTHMRTGLILHCSSPYPGGACEASIVEAELKDELVPGERLLGDCGYALWPSRFVVPKHHEAGRTLNSIRATVEHSVGRVKSFGILSTSAFRSTEYEWHGDLTQLVCRIINHKFSQ